MDLVSRRLVVLFVLVAIAVSVVAVSPASAQSTVNEDPDDVWMTNGHVYSVIRDGDYIYVGGYFTKVRKSPDGEWYKATNLARFHADTGIGDKDWTPDVTGTDMSFSGTHVDALAAAGGKIWVGGKFQAVDNQPRRNLAAVSPQTGEVDQTVKPIVGSETAGGVRALLASDNLVYVGGAFSTVDGKNRRNLAALNTNGELDPTWRPRADRNVYSLAFDSAKATVFVGGTFRNVTSGSDVTTYIPRETVARFDPTTGVLNPWAIPAGTVPENEVGADLAVTGERITVAYLGSNWLRSFRLDQGNIGAQVWALKGAGDPQTVAMLGPNKVVVGGHFRSIGTPDGGTVKRQKIAIVNLADGSLDPWNPGLKDDPALNREIAGPWDLLVNENHLYVGGQFYLASDLVRTNFARFTFPGS